MLDWTRKDWSMKMRETSRRQDKKPIDNNVSKYHAHGDSSIEGAAVYMAQWFNMGPKTMLIDGHGE